MRRPSRAMRGPSWPAAIVRRASRRSTSSATRRTSSWSGASSADPAGVLPVHAATPALLPHALADGAGDARMVGRRRDHAYLGRAAGDLEHQLGADRLAELLALADRHHERAWSANHAVLVVDVEVRDIHGGGIGPLEHDRQPVDGD